MQNQNENSPLISILEIILLFLLAIFGNQIADSFSIPPNSLFLFAGILLLTLSILSYLRSGRLKPKNQQSLKRFFPRSMIGIFPVGIVFGFFSGAICTALDSNQIYYSIPKWLTKSFIGSDMALSQAEVIGVLIGLSIWLIIAIWINSYLSAAFLCGYGIAFPAAIIFVNPRLHLASLTFLGHISFFIIFGVSLVLLTPIIKRLSSVFKSVATEQRI